MPASSATVWYWRRRRHACWQTRCCSVRRWLIRGLTRCCRPGSELPRWLRGARCSFLFFVGGFVVEAHLLQAIAQRPECHAELLGSRRTVPACFVQRFEDRVLLDFEKIVFQRAAMAFRHLQRAAAC